MAISTTTMTIRLDGLNIKRVTLTHDETAMTWTGHDFNSAMAKAKSEVVEAIVGGLTALPIDSAKIAHMMQLAAVYRNLQDAERGVYREVEEAGKGDGR